MAILDLQLFAKEFLTAKKGKEVKLPSRQWANQFVNKHPMQVQNKIGKLFDSKRLRAVKRENLNDFYDLLEIAYAKTKLSLPEEVETLRKVVFNCDETAISLRPKKISILMPRGNYSAVIDDNKTSFQYNTVLVCANAAGDLIRPFIIYRNLPNPIPDQYKSWDLPVYRTSKSGWMTTLFFELWFEKIFLVAAEKHRPQNYTGPIILLYDGHSTHFSDKINKLASVHNVVILRFPSHSTHLLQPLDVSFFGPFKNILAQILRNKLTGDLSGDKNTLDRVNFAGILKEVWTRIDGSAVRKVFRDTRVLTDSGIDREAISGSQILQALPYSDDGTILMTEVLEHLSEVIPPVQDPSQSFALLQLQNTLEKFKIAPTKRKTIRNIH